MINALVVSIVVGGSRSVFESKSGTIPVLSCGCAEMTLLGSLSASAVNAMTTK